MTVDEVFKYQLSRVDRVPDEQFVDVRADQLSMLLAEITRLRMKVDGGRVIIEAVEAAARANVNTRLSEIKVERVNGPPFYLVEALLPRREAGGS